MRLDLAAHREAHSTTFTRIHACITTTQSQTESRASYSYSCPPRTARAGHDRGPITLSRSSCIERLANQVNLCPESKHAGRCKCTPLHMHTLRATSRRRRRCRRRRRHTQRDAGGGILSTPWHSESERKSERTKRSGKREREREREGRQRKQELKKNERFHLVVLKK
jgi:hypothetical protein